MLMFVLTVNGIISVGCFWLTWRIWTLRRTLALVANALQKIEQNTHSLLHQAPSAIANGQISVRKIRKRCQSYSAY
jgi:hypothetical protein